MIQRIAEEAKLTDLDINAEERVSPKTTSTNEKGMNTLIVFSKPLYRDHGTIHIQLLILISFFSESSPITRKSPSPLNSNTSIFPDQKIIDHRKHTHLKKYQHSLRNTHSDKPSVATSRFPLTGSYGGIINMNSNITGKEPRNDESDSRNMKSFLQNEQQQLANCVQLIAADMVEFEKEPLSNLNHVPTNNKPPQFSRLEQSKIVIPNAEVFQGTCADDSWSSQHDVIKFPTQPLDLSSFSAPVVAPFSATSAANTLPLAKLQAQSKRKRIRKPTEAFSMNIMPMTPMPHASKDDDIEKEEDPSVDSGIGPVSPLVEKSQQAPKKRRRNVKARNNAELTPQLGSPRSLDGRQNLPSPPPLTPIRPQSSSGSFLSMPILSDMPSYRPHYEMPLDRIEIKTEVTDYEKSDSDRDLGLVIDTDGEED